MVYQVLILDNEEGFAETWARYLRARYEKAIIDEQIAPDRIEVSVANDLVGAQELMTSIEFDAAWVDLELEKSATRLVLDGLDFAISCKQMGVCTVVMSSYEYALAKARKEGFPYYYDKRLRDEVAANDMIRSFFLSLQDD